MKKLLLLLVVVLITIPLPQIAASGSVVRITAPAQQTFSGEFRNDELAELLTPSGRLGLLVFRPAVTTRTWVIDAALIDEIALMSTQYTLATEAEPAGKEIALAWLNQLKSVTAANEVVALAYGNPDVALAKRLAPSELRRYFVFGKERLQLTLGRSVRSEPDTQWSIGKSNLSNPQRKIYSDNRKALTRLSLVVESPELDLLRARLAQLLSPSLNKDSRQFFSFSSTTAVKKMIKRLRINSGKYQISSASVELPVTVINDFDVDVTVDISMVTSNSRVIVSSFEDITVPARSKRQLEMQVDVIARGETVVSVLITDNDQSEVVPASLLTLNSQVIDSRVTWFTTGAAILLLLAAVAQSVRRVRRRVK